PSCKIRLREGSNSTDDHERIRSSAVPTFAIITKQHRGCPAGTDTRGHLRRCWPATGGNYRVRLARFLREGSNTAACAHRSAGSPRGRLAEWGPRPRVAGTIPARARRGGATGAAASDPAKGCG